MPVEWWDVVALLVAPLAAGYALGVAIDAAWGMVELRRETRRGRS